MEESTGIYYHGTKTKDVFDQFITPEGTAEMDVTKGGVVYTTTDPDRAIKYAKDHGQVVVCSIDPRKAIPYGQQRDKQGLPRKKGGLTRDVFVSLPSDVTPEIFFNPKTFAAIMKMDEGIQ